MITNKNTPLLHKKEWQMLTPAIQNTATAHTMITSWSWLFNIWMLVTSNTVQQLYHHDEDAWVNIPSWALAWTFWAWVTGEYHPWSVTYTATWWSTTTLTVNSAVYNLRWLIRNCKLEFLSWNNIWEVRNITSVDLSWWWSWTITITLDTALPNTVINNDTFRINSWKIFVLWAWTLASWSFKSFDLWTMAWTTLSNTWLPATWWTDWKIRCPYNYWDVIATWTATSWTSVTLVNSAKTWATNQWTNYQVKIIWWTWIWQVRAISSNTATTLTVPTWTVTPDATSVYEISVNEDFLYLIWNNAVTMYKYSISSNSWSTVSPTVARAAAPWLWATFDWNWVTWDTVWANESLIKDWRYIYSFQWWATANLHRYDIVDNKWETINYTWWETFTTWSSWFIMWRYIYLRKDATNRFFKYSITWNYLEPLATLLYTDWVGLLWHKLWVKKLDSTSWVMWLYSLWNTSNILFRLLLF